MPKSKKFKVKTDLQGRAYAQLSQLQEGDIVVVDGDFTCVSPWSQLPVKRKPDSRELYIPCAHKEHLLSEQLDKSDGDSLIGIYPKISFTPRRTDYGTERTREKGSGA